MTRAAPKAKPYTLPVSKDGKTPLPPLNADTIIVRRDDAVPVDLLVEFHRNPNKGNVKVIRESIAENGGLFRGVVGNVGTLTGRPHEILAGNHTWKSAKAEGKETVPVDWVDVDDQRAVKIMSVDNAAAKKGKVDADVLASLLVDLDDLAGSGVTDAELARMVAPAGASGDLDDIIATRFELVIECEDEGEQQELHDRLTDEGLTVRVLTM